MKHPNYEPYKHKGTHGQILEKLCYEYPYVVIRRGSLPNDWFEENVKHRFTFCSDGQNSIWIFFDNANEAVAADRRFNPAKYEEKD